MIEHPTLEEIHNFNYYLLSSFGKNGKDLEELISQLENMAEMPIEILCKYWIRVFILESPKFYSILNYSLKNKRFKLFLPFIKMSYEGVKKKLFNSTVKEELYSGGGFSNLELVGMKNILTCQKKSFIIPNHLYHLVINQIRLKDLWIGAKKIIFLYYLF